jgi:hypothetical protein
VLRELHRGVALFIVHNSLHAQFVMLNSFNYVESSISASPFNLYLIFALDLVVVFIFFDDFVAGIGALAFKS